MCGIKQMADESIGDVMELRKVGKGRGFHLLGRQACLGEVRRTFAGQRFDAVLFHFHMKQKPVGARAIAEGLQGGDVGPDQGHTIFGETEYFAMPLEDVE